MPKKHTDPEAFERERRDLFARYGFEADARRVDDRAGRATYLLSRGDGERPTVLVHGGLSQAGEWARVAGRIPGRVVIPDRPGCGLSYPVDYRSSDYRKAAADWLLGLLDAINANEVDLVGNSMGGYFSIAFALAHPDRVRRLVLVGAPAGLDDRPGVPLFPRLWGNPITGALIRRVGIDDPEVLRRRAFPMLVADPEQVPLDELETHVRSMALPGAAWSAYTLLRRVTTLRGFRRDLMLRDELAGLAVPTLFLWGDADAFAPPASGRDMVARMPAAAIEELADTGHLPHVERPETVAAAISRFLIGGAEGS